MKSKANLPNSLIIAALALLMGAVGLTAAYFRFMTYDLPWHTYRLSDPPKGAAGIVHVEYQANQHDPAGDTIYVVTQDGSVYANRLFTKGWGLVQSNPSREEDRSSACAPVWPGAQSEAEIWSAPPVEKKVVDSRGVRFEHSASIAVRCYMLSEDGSLEVWTREDSIMGIIAFLQCGPVYALAGALLGVLTGIVVTRLRKTVKGAIEP